MIFCRAAAPLLVLLLAMPALAAKLDAAASAAGGSATSQADPGGVSEPGGGWEQFVPPTDGSFTTWTDAPPDLGLVKRIFALGFTEECGWALGGNAGESEESPQIYDITYRESYDLPADPDRLARLYRFFCNAGAYNVQHVYMTWSKDGGLRPVLFAEPSIDTRYKGENDDQNLESIAVAGFVATPTLVNSWYDPEAMTIYNANCWRGLCDASSHAAYVFRSGGFTLLTYDADPTYDDQVNAYRVFDATAPQALELVPVAEEDLPRNPEWDDEGAE